MEKLSKKLSEDYTNGNYQLSGYEDFFNGLLEITSEKPLCEQLGKEIDSYVTDYVKTHELHADHYNDESYCRNYIGRDDESGWEAIVMSWKKGNRTSIHSHPQFASYAIADGSFLVEIFERIGDDGAKLTASVEINEPKCLYALAETEDFRNHLHRITCLSETGHSLHVYSNDALKGYVYKETE